MERQKRKLKVSIITVVVLLIICMMASSCSSRQSDSGLASTVQENNKTLLEESKTGQGSNEATQKNGKAGASGNSADSTLTADNPSSMQEDKRETVYAKADAQGNITGITVQDTLKCDSTGAQISDYSILKDMKNTKGDEEYVKQPDGTLLWDNQGEDISYEGTTEKELPVSVRIRYELDGKEVRAEELAGKSGRLKLRFDYENHTSETVNADGKEREVQVPFLAMSALLLDTDVFSNVQVTNGKLISMGNQNMAVGYAFPGLKNSLKLDDYATTEDMEVPDYVEITADVTDFELEFTATVITTGIFEEMDTEDLKDAEDLADSMEELTKTSAKLVNGSGELLSGAKTFQTGLDQYVEGVGSVNEGIKSLKDGLSALDENTSALEDGAKALQEGAASLQEGAGALMEGIKMLDQIQEIADAAATQQAKSQAAAALDQVLAGNEHLTEEEKAQIRSAVADSIHISGDAFKDIRQQLEIGSEQLGSGTGKLESGSEQLAEGIYAYGQGVSQLAEGADTLYSGSDKLVSSGSTLTEGMDTLMQGIRSVSEGMSAFDKEGIQKMGELAQNDLSNVITGFKAIKKADRRYDNFSGISENKTGSVKFIIETEEIKKEG